MAEPTEDFDYLFKVVIIGDQGVGKSCILSRFCKNKFDPNQQSTLGIEFATKIVKISDKWIKAQIWDTAGQERFDSLTSAYYRHAVCALVVYDITRRKSFESLPKWINSVRQFADPQGCLMMIVGNKCDLENQRAVSTAEAREFATSQHLSFIETSALNNQNVSECFIKLIEEVYYAILAINSSLESPSTDPNKPLPSSTVVVDTSPPEPQQETKCC